jgi:hypothetical protein
MEKCERKNGAQKMSNKQPNITEKEQGIKKNSCCLQATENTYSKFVR